MNRRALHALLMTLPIATALQAAEQPILLGKGPFLLIDQRFVEKIDRVQRRVCVPERLPYPVVTAAEDKCFQPYLTVVRDETSRQFRMWYGIPVSESQTHIAYLESPDGLVWRRPHRVLPDPGKIQFGVCVIDEGPAFSNPAQRYKFGWYNDGGLRIATSADGFDFKAVSDKPVVEHNHDITSIFRDPVRNQYVAMVSSYTTGEKWTGNRRIPMQTTSVDCVNWKKPWVVTSPDEKDEGDTQYYCMGGLIERGGMLIGMLRVLRDDLPAEAGGPVQGLGYTVLAWSHDGVTWQRDREAFLPRNPQPGTWDRAMTWADSQLVVDDQTYIYYGGYARGHKPGRFTDRQIGLARMPRDRYVGWVSGPWDGRLLTRPLVFGGSELIINAKVEGELRVRVLHLDGKPLAGFDFDDCRPFHGDSVSHRVQWNGGAFGTAGQPVRFEFSIQSGEIYSFDVPVPGK